MRYPEEFKERVKKAYPEAKKLHKALDNQDDDAVSYILTWNCNPVVNAERILECKSLDEVRELAGKALERRSVYDEYLSLLRKNG